MTYTRWNWKELGDQALNWAIEHPDGFTKPQLAEALGVPEGVVGGIFRLLRHRLAADTMNLVGDPQGQRERWLFHLVGNQAQAVAWEQMRLGDTETRLRITRDVVTSMGLDRTDAGGYTVRLIQKSIDRLIEDLGDIRSGLNTAA